MSKLDDLIAAIESRNIEQIRVDFLLAFDGTRDVAEALLRSCGDAGTGRGWFVTVVEDAALELESLRMAAIDRSHAVRRAAAEKRTATRAKRRK